MSVTVSDSPVPLEWKRTHLPAQWPHTMCLRSEWSALAMTAHPAQQLGLLLAKRW